MAADSDVVRSRKVQAKDIPDEDFIAAVAVVSQRTAAAWGHKDAWANRFDVAEELGFPEKVVLAKAKAVIKKGRMDGCVCGCRGDFDLRGYPDDPFAATKTAENPVSGRNAAE